jgi:hypothetical protein
MCDDLSSASTEVIACYGENASSDVLPTKTRGASIARTDFAEKGLPCSLTCPAAANAADIPRRLSLPALRLSASELAREGDDLGPLLGVALATLALADGLALSFPRCPSTSGQTRTWFQTPQGAQAVSISSKLRCLHQPATLIQPSSNKPRGTPRIAWIFPAGMDQTIELLGVATWHRSPPARQADQQHRAARRT